MFASLPGFEPGTFGLEVQRAIHCATGTVKDFGLGYEISNSGITYHLTVQERWYNLTN